MKTLLALLLSTLSLLAATPSFKDLTNGAVTSLVVSNNSGGPVTNTFGGALDVNEVNGSARFSGQVIMTYSNLFALAQAAGYGLQQRPLGQDSTWVIAGDSISTHPNSYLWWLTNSTNPSLGFTNYFINAYTGFITNFAVPGWGLHQLTNSFATTFPPFASNSRTQRVAFIEVGANDQASWDPYDWITAMSNYLGQVKGYGYKTALFTTMPITNFSSGDFGGFTFPMQWKTVTGNWLRQSPLVDYLIDMEQILPNPFNQEYFQTDGIHPNAYGHLQIARAIEKSFTEGPHRNNQAPILLTQDGYSVVVRNPFGTTPFMIMNTTNGIRILNGINLLRLVNDTNAAIYASQGGGAASGAVLQLNQGASTNIWIMQKASNIVALMNEFGVIEGPGLVNYPVAGDAGIYPQSSGILLIRGNNDTNPVVRFNQTGGAAHGPSWITILNGNVTSALNEFGVFEGSGIRNIRGTGEAVILTPPSGLVASRSVNDDNPAWEVQQKGGTSTGPINKWTYGTNEVARLTTNAMLHILGVKMTNRVAAPTGPEIGVNGSILWSSNAVIYGSVSPDAVAVTTKQIVP